LQACNACDGCSAIDAGGSLGEIVAVIMIVAFAFIAVYLLALGVRALWRWWRRPPPVRPHGAEARGLEVGRFAGRTGTVVARGTAPRRDRRRALRGVRAASGLPGSRRAGDAARQRRRRLRRRARRRRGGRDPRRPAGARRRRRAGARGGADLRRAPRRDRSAAPRADDLDPFAATHVRQVVLADGDRVEVRGRLVPMPGAASGAAYRGVTSERWLPDGVPQLVRAS
jgi:hypothetical protein